MSVFVCGLHFVPVHKKCASDTKNVPKCIYNQLLKSGHIDCCARTRITSVA